MDELRKKLETYRLSKYAEDDILETVCKLLNNAQREAYSKPSKEDQFVEEFLNLFEKAVETQEYNHAELYAKRFNIIMLNDPTKSAHVSKQIERWSKVRTIIEFAKKTCLTDDHLKKLYKEASVSENK